MNPKVILAILIAVTMVVPCAAAMEATTADAEEATSDLALGDAWGIKYTPDKDDLIELLLGDEEIPEEYQEMYDMIYDAVKKANLEAALMIEIVRADESGYTASVDGGIIFDFSFLFDDDIPLGDEELPLKADASAKVVIVLQGLVNFDKDLAITSVDLKIDALITAELKTNFSMMKYVELMNDESEMTINDVLTDTDNISTVKAGASLSYSMYSPDGSVATSNREGEDIDYELTLNGKHTLFASVFINIDGEIAELLQYIMIDNGDEDDAGDAFDLDQFIIDEDTIQASFILGDTTTDTIEFVLSVIQGEELDDGMFEYIFRFGEIQFRSFDLMPSDLPEFETLAELEIDRENELYLDSTEKTQVRSVFNKVKSAYDGSASNLSFTVTYDVDGVETTQKVGFNKRISPPAVSDKTVDNTTLKFVGWSIEDGPEWNPTWGVKSDMTLYPIYAQTFTDATETMNHLNGTTGESAYIRVTGVSGLEDFLDSDFSFDGTLYIDVYDDNGKYLFSWTIFNDGTPLEPDTVMQLGIEKKTLTDEQKNQLSEGRLSGEHAFIYIDFEASGIMPGKTTVSYYVGDDFADGTVIQIYHVVFDGEGNMIGLEPVKSATVVDGRVTFDLDHCSGYVLSAAIIPSSGNDNTMLYIGIAIAAAIIVLLAVALLVRRSRSA